MNDRSGSHKGRESVAARLWRTTAERALRGIRNGTVVIAAPSGTSTFGSGEAVARVRVHDPACFLRMALGGTAGAGESYMAGLWDCDELVDLVRIMLRNRDALSALEGLASVPAAVVDAMFHLMRRNSRAGRRRNIREHYDLGNEFFRLFLDERLMYSAAVYETPEDSLEAASTAKLDRLCRKLRLTRGERLLEIGTGWGGLAVYAAENYGCHVTTATISESQYEYAKALVSARGLSDQVDVILADYRDLRGSYDKLVSVEMVEAVGHAFLDRYFETCAGLIRRDGMMVLQAIVIRDTRYRRALHKADFIKKHIFPGGFIPSISALTAAAARADLSVMSLEDFADDYALTLRDWRRNLDNNADGVQALGFDASFLRKWRFYFAYCEGGFRERAISDVQVVYTKSDYRGPPWRAS
ncbi:MAG: class I SAM-dependent methyltransferase [Gammaproteobacteria bacterium]|nr:class I SAM-dependent methyltransferase [Gammaproteobacteria bacterium]